MTGGRFILGLLFLAAAQAVVQPKKEYQYDGRIRIGSGTLDHAPHVAGMIFTYKLRLQMDTMDLAKIELSDVKQSEVVGELSDEGLTFVDFPMKLQMAIELENGFFKSLMMPSGLPTVQKNGLKAFASLFQGDLKQVTSGNQAFKANEQTIHGECEVSYLVTSDSIVKSVNHGKDCKNRPIRRFDSVQGYDCEPEKKDKTDGFVSTATTIYLTEGDGTEKHITKIIQRGSFVAQLFETEGVSHIALANNTLTLTSVQDSPGDIGGGTETVTSLRYEFGNSGYKWNEDRDLKAAEPLMDGAGDFLSDTQDNLKKTLVGLLGKQKEILHTHDTDKESIEKAHKYGIDTLQVSMMSMDYGNLKAIYSQLYSDKSEDGVMQSNIFTELLGSTGTTASAMLVLDLLKGKEFDNARDTARALTSVPFHIRRPNTQLVEAYKELLDLDQESIVEMAIPLTFGHLVHATCWNAGQPRSAEQIECFKTLGKKWTEHFWGKWKEALQANNRELKNLYISTIQNIGYGGHMKILKDLIYGQLEGATSEDRSMAIFAAFKDVAVHKKTIEFHFPVFAERKNDHEVRISALDVILHGKPSSTDFAGIIAVMKTEKDYEVVNFVFAALEAKASSICPCDRKVKEAAQFFLKYMKQLSKYKTDWGFGVSKTYSRQFNKEKYGYGGTYSFYTVGSHKSTTPLAVGMGIKTYMHHSYKAHLLHVHLRLEGVAKGLIKKFKTMDPATWKTADLTAILKNEMSIRERPDQPIRVKVLVMMKGSIVICRSYDDSKRAGSLLSKIQALGDQYSINHQRVLKMGQLIVEQPTVLGIPALYMASVTTLISLKADVKKGSNRGMLYREIEYELNGFTQSRSGMLLVNEMQKKFFGVAQNRIYLAQNPRRLFIGVNPIKKELKLRVSRAKYDDPTMFLMHSKNSVFVRSTILTAKDEDLKKLCPRCEDTVIVSAGEGAAKDRTIFERECKKYGYRISAKYFDCEMDVSRRHTIGHIIKAFLPFDKNPKTGWTALTLGLRQVRAFLFYFPRAEKCGVVAKWSQSRENPVKDIELAVQVSTKSNGEKLFFRGKKLQVKAILKAKGDQERTYKLTFKQNSAPLNLKNDIKVMFVRAANDALGIKPAVACLVYESRYPSFSTEMFNVDLNTPLKVTGKARLKYGEANSCETAPGEITLAFDHSTTQEARESLKKKWYYKKCMETKNSEAWKGRDALPVSRPCYMTAYDAAAARRYKLDFKFIKLTDRMKNILSKVRSIVRIILMRPLDGDNSQLGKFLKIDATFKDGDSLADVVLESSSGTKTISDYPVRLDWSKRLRNLKFSKTAMRLHKLGLIKPCIATSTYVQTMDNVTYNYAAPDCWTLMSGHCGPSPSYAVFVKKNAPKPLAMKAYIGGHLVEIDAASNSVKIDGAAVTVTDDDEHLHKVDNVEILKVTKWGSTYNIYSFMRVWIAFDGNFVTVTPAPSVKGQHCGLCGNYNRNKYDEHIKKDGETFLAGGFAEMAEEWKWKC